MTFGGRVHNGDLTTNPLSRDLVGILELALLPPHSGNLDLNNSWQNDLLETIDPSIDCLYHP